MKVFWTNNALAHLVAIYDYISRDSSFYAQTMVDRLTRRSQQAGQFPMSGRVVPEYDRDDVRELIPFESIYAVIRRIPPGRVATYGQVAALAGLPGRARLVGRSLRETPDGVDVPWQRVINARGEVSPRGGLGMEEGLQRHLLEEEGVVFDQHGRIDMDLYGWDPEARPPSRRKGKG